MLRCCPCNWWSKVIQWNGNVLGSWSRVFENMMSSTEMRNTKRIKMLPEGVWTIHQRSIHQATFQQVQITSWKAEWPYYSPGAISLGNYSLLKLLLQLKQNNAKQFQNKHKTIPKHFVFGWFQHFVHVKQNIETIQKQTWLIRQPKFNCTRRIMTLYMT